MGSTEALIFEKPANGASSCIGPSLSGFELHKWGRCSSCRKTLGRYGGFDGGRLPYPPLSTVGVVPDPEGAPVVGHLEDSHHLAKRAPQRYYGYRGYNRGYRSRGGGGNNRARTAVLFGKTALTAGAAGVALCLAFNCGK